MSKLFRYELHRMVCSKIFLGLLAVLLWFAWQVLTGQTILGTAHTAPFSPWSFGAYLSALLPLLSLSLLFFLWEVCSGAARQVEILADATPTEHGRLLFLKGCAAASAWLLLALAAAGLGLGFLLVLFGEAVPVGELLAAAALVLLPPLAFLLGVGLLLGRIRPGLIFLLLPAVVCFALCPLPMPVQLFAGQLFSVYPLDLGLDPDLSVPLSVLIGRLAYGAAGLAAAAAAGAGRRKARGA